MSSRLLIKALSLLGAGIWVPASALAEGAVKLLDCEVRRVCDATGQCADTSATVSFRMEPIALELAGAGSYRIQYADMQAEMSALSDAGPFLWNVERQRHALIASSANQWLWHQLTLSGEPEASIRFLICRFQQ